MHSAKLAGLVGHNPPVVHGHDDAYIGPAGGVVLAYDFVVLLAVARGGVDAARPRLQGDMLAQQNNAVPVVKGVPCHHQFKLGALHLGKGFKALYIAGLGHAPCQLLGDNIDLPGRGLGQNIIQTRIKAYGKVPRNRPGGGSPYDKVDVFQVGIPGELAKVVLYGELYIEGLAGVVGIFNFRLCQGCLIVRAPIHGLFAPVNIALLIHLAEYLDFLGLELRGHGEIGPVPVPQHAKALELLPLNVHEIFRELLALVAELGDGHLLPVQLVLFYDFALNGHAVVVPAGGVGGVVAGHVLVPDNKILKAFVQGRPHMNVTVGKRRPVVENEHGFALIFLHNLLVQVHVVPFF